MRRGYTIIELLGLVAILALIFSLSARPIWIMARETPHISRMYDLQQQVDLFCGQLQRDIEAADTIRTVPGAGDEDAPVLHLQVPGGGINWLIQPGSAQRVEETVSEEAEPKRSWTLPHVELEWSLYEPNGSPAGVEIRSWVNRPLLGKQRDKFQQSRLFFMGVRENTL